jgi:multicomponent Na+:H+ antiporter subunit B
MRQGFILLAIAGMVLIFAKLGINYSEQQSLSQLAHSYLTRTPSELGSANVITGILITYRGFDTLGEVAVLFMAAAGIGILLAAAKGQSGSGEKTDPGRPPSEFLRRGGDIILPLIFLFGAYVVMNGHISAGGGFQGGAVLASGAVLLVVAYPETVIAQGALSITESLAGALYVLTGIFGLILAGGFLDSRFLPAGNIGDVFSAGAIPIISILLGIKVGAELTVIIARFRDVEGGR